MLQLFTLRQRQSMGTLVLHLLLHYENVKKVSDRKISYFRRKIILYYYTKKNSTDKNG